MIFITIFQIYVNVSLISISIRIDVGGVGVLKDVGDKTFLACFLSLVLSVEFLVVVEQDFFVEEV